MGSAFLAVVLINLATGAVPTEAELVEAQHWAAAKFAGTPENQLPIANGIEVIANNDPVQMNARAGKALNIAGQSFSRGLYCHANSKLIVHLSEAAERFEAIAGIDTNDNTSGGRGSVVYSVKAGGREAWRSELMHEGMPGTSVSVDLNGATEIVLEINDGGDGISCDQADWANARVVLKSGKEVWLGDLAVVGQQRRPYNADPLFAFTYDGKPSSEFLAGWQFERRQKILDNARTEHTLQYSDPETGLTVRCIGIQYTNFPVVEWTLYFTNTSGKDTPIISDILPIDTQFDRSSKEEFVLYRHKGDDCTADSFQPFNEPLKPGTEKRIANTGGRPTQMAFPYFNIAAGNQEGLIFVVSWAGQWGADFIRDDSNGLRLRAGQEQTHFKLLPGEEVRTPMIVLQFWKGDRFHAQNVWRAWMIAHNLPRPGGKLPPAPELAACSSHQFAEMTQANTESQKFFIDHYLERGLKLDYWWMDAGWYPCDSSWPKTGTWEVDQTRFPGGLRPISDHAHSKDVKIIVWFEPERVAADTWLTKTHPEWIHGGEKGGLLDLGNPEARQWLTDHVDQLITSEGIDLYRQDFNIDPLPFWRAKDTEDRQGITEIRHVEGYFAYWDELLRRHPNMLIDSCASGGRRNDLETLRRAVPLLRSDYIMEPVGNQCHTYALSLWFPFYGTGSSKADTYQVRSTMCPHYTACWDQRVDNIDWANLRRIMDQWKNFAPYYYGDYYPITPYSLDNSQWIGWQFNQDDGQEGMVHVFRRAESVYESARLPLLGLDPQARYRVSNLDTPDTSVELTGEELMGQGLPVSITEKPGTGFFVYKKI